MVWAGSQAANGGCGEVQGAWPGRLARLPRRGAPLWRSSRAVERLADMGRRGSAGPLRHYVRTHLGHLAPAGLFLPNATRARRGGTARDAREGLAQTVGMEDPHGDDSLGPGRLRHQKGRARAPRQLPPRAGRRADGRRTAVRLPPFRGALHRLCSAPPLYRGGRAQPSTRDSAQERQRRCPQSAKQRANAG